MFLNQTPIRTAAVVVWSGMKLVAAVRAEVKKVRSDEAERKAQEGRCPVFLDHPQWGAMQCTGPVNRVHEHWIPGGPA